MNPKVSIIVPVYKVPENFLRQCIESLINQTLKEIEILLVDDGSPDECGKICDSYAEKDSRIRVIHKENGGLSAARNTGYKNAKAEWITFVDGDDWIEPDMCDYLYNEATKNDVQLVMCGLYKDFGTNAYPYKFYLEDHKIYRDEECKWLQQQLLVYNGNIAVAYAKLISKVLLDQYDIQHNEKLKQGAEGLEFNLRLFGVLEKAEFVNKPFYHYIYNSDSISSKSTEENNDYIISCFEKIKEYINESDNREKLELWFDNRLLYVIVTIAISGYFHPENKLPYRTRKKNFDAFLRKNIIHTALQTKNLKGVNKQRRFVLFCIKHHLYFMLEILGRLRKWQKLHK